MIVLNIQWWRPKYKRNVRQRNSWYSAFDLVSLSIASEDGENFQLYTIVVLKLTETFLAHKHYAIFEDISRDMAGKHDTWLTLEDSKFDGRGNGEAVWTCFETRTGWTVIQGINVCETITIVLWQPPFPQNHESADAHKTCSPGGFWLRL